jgi:hypothetical protein
MERSVTPVLAGVVAYLDTNRNLDLLEADDHAPYIRTDAENGNWVCQLWLNLVSDPQVHNLHVNDLLAMSGEKRLLVDFACVCTFLAPDCPRPALPFSWILTQLIHAFFHNTPAGMCWLSSTLFAHRFFFLMKI